MDGATSSQVPDEHMDLELDNKYNTIFTKKLLNRQKSNENILNSTLESNENSEIISQNPSNTSFGLENTFKVLNDRLNYKKISEFIYIKDNNIILMNQDECDETDKPDLLELEIEALKVMNKRKKCDSVSSSSCLSVDSIESDEVCSDDTVLQNVGEYPKYIYHISKHRDGKLFIRNIKSLPIEKVLSGERVSHMTRTYDDIEAVTRLLEEKEKDLELTVQIGKELLSQNNRLENRVSELESNLKTMKENFQQLSYELNQKNELIAILTNDVEDTSHEIETPTSPSKNFINLDLLQRKITSLQEENLKLRHETQEIAKETDECEEKEKQLMFDITNQLNSTNNQFELLNLELERYREDNRVLNEQICNLTGRLSETEMRLHELSTENEEATSILSITKENQNLLATELAEFKLRYQEVVALLSETQEQLRKAKKRSQPTMRGSFLCGLPIPQADSLQNELLETSMYSENSLDSGIAVDRNRCGSLGGMSNNTNNSNNNVPAYKKIFETVRCATKSSDEYSESSNNMLHLGVMSLSSSSQPKMSAFVNLTDSGIAQSYRSSSGAYTKSICSSQDDSLGHRVLSQESLISNEEASYPAQPPLGCPGAPGAKDLEAALNRLTPAEVLARRAMLSHAPAGTYTYDDNVPAGCRTPDSIMSLGGYSVTASGFSNSNYPQWRLPEKLQIVKPMEGSQTLRNWKSLATPTLSGLLEERPGVTIRGGRGLDELGLQVYSLSDCEEDIDDNPGKRFQSSSCVYTYTNSTVMHPDDGTSVVSSMPTSQIASRMMSSNVSRQTSAPMTPRASLSRRNSCSTFSVSLGLASMLNERGIKAVTPSALNTPCGVNYTPTVTPCNSPEGSSPNRYMSPEPQFLSNLISTGADILRRKLIGEALESNHQHSNKKSRPGGNKVMLSRLEKRALRSINILEKVEHMGLDSIIPQTSTSMCHLPPLHGSSSIYSTRSSSPMAQLTSLKKINTSDGEEVRIDKETIKAVLSKGLSSENSTLVNSPEKVSKTKQLTKVVDRDSSDSEDLHDRTKERNSQSINRLKHMQRQKSRRTMRNGNHGGQRPDLGTVGNSSNNLMYKKSDEKIENSSIGFIGSISSLLFGRKGGLL